MISQEALLVIQEFLNYCHKLRTTPFKLALNPIPHLFMQEPRKYKFVTRIPVIIQLLSNSLVFIQIWRNISVLSLTEIIIHFTFMQCWFFLCCTSIFLLKKAWEILAILNTSFVLNDQIGKQFSIIFYK